MEENVCLRTRCKVDEQVMRRAFVAQRWVYTALMMVFALVLFAQGLYYLIVFHSSSYSIFFFMLALIIVVLVPLQTQQFAKLTMRRVKEMHGVDIYESQVDCTGEELVLRNNFSQDSLHFRYETLKKVYIDGGLIVVMSKAKQFFLLDRDRFENGTVEDFWRLLAQKAPQAKLPRQAKR